MRQALPKVAADRQEFSRKTAGTAGNGARPPHASEKSVKSAPMGMRVTVGDVLVDCDARELSRGGVALHLSPKAFELLLLLIECRPKAVSKRELQDRLWPDTFVVEKNLTNLIAEIRKAVGDTPPAPRLIRTVQRFGYALREASPVVDIEHARPANATGTVRLAWDGGTTTLRDGDHIIGRDPEASIVLNVDSVSRRHAIITVAGSYATLADLGSKNGTSIGSARIDKVTRLVEGDQIHIGSVLLTVRFADPLDATKTEMHPSGTWSGLVSAGGIPRDESSRFRDATLTLQPGVNETTLRRGPPVLSPGETFGRFRLIQLLGRGGMGEVYEAEDLKSGERVALKMSREVLATEQQREQFLREGRVVAAISHPHLVYVVGTEEIQEIPVLVTELVTGTTLRARVTEGGPLPSIEAVDIDPSGHLRPGGARSPWRPASRRQAVQLLRRPGRSGQGRGLRSCDLDKAQRNGYAKRGRCGHAGIRLARAASGRAAGHQVGHLLSGRDASLLADGARSAFRRRGAGSRRPLAEHAGTDARSAAQTGQDRSAVSGAEPCPPAPLLRATIDAARAVQLGGTGVRHPGPARARLRR